MNKGFPQEAKKIMDERFGHDTLLSLATTDQNIPYVRTVNAYYENGCFYIITYAASNKMKQIDHNPIVAVAGEWFTAHGKGINLGWFCKKENHEIAQKLVDRNIPGHVQLPEKHHQRKGHNDGRNDHEQQVQRSDVGNLK